MPTTALRSGRLAALLLLATLPGCQNTYQKKIEPSDEQQLDLYTTTATYLYEDDELLRAQEQAVKALEIDPKNRAMRRMIGWIRLRLGTNEDLLIAERFFRDLFRERDENEATSLGLAITCERLGKAYDDVSRALASGEREPSAGKEREKEAQELAKKARALWEEGIALLERSLESGEGSTNAMNALQRLYALMGRYEESLAWSERLLERSSAELEAWRRMLTDRDLSGREEELFRSNAKAAVDLQIDTHLFVAAILQRLERVEDAIAHLDQVVVESPDLPQAYSLRAQLEVRAGRFPEAIRDIDRYLALSDQPFEHPEVRRAFELRTECEKQLAAR
jgi:tetratricopeptide (TPR) repeat protein